MHVSIEVAGEDSESFEIWLIEPGLEVIAITRPFSSGIEWQKSTCGTRLDPGDWRVNAQNRKFKLPKSSNSDKLAL